VAESLTFAEYSPMTHGPEGIYRIGATAASQQGVIQEMARAFDHELSPTPDVDNLGQLIAKVGQAKELQENIGRVQEVLGTNEDAVSMARDWVERSGMLVPVERTFAEGNDRVHIQYGLGIITGGIRNWMNRRAEIALSQLPSHDVWFVAGNRSMKSVEGPDVEDGMSEAEYLREAILPKFEGTGIKTALVEVDSAVGDEVMSAGAEKIAAYSDLTNEDVSIVVVSNAGAWVQNTGQFRRALRNIQPEFDSNGNQLSVISDAFPLGTGVEPTITHQNPFSALGQIARNAQEFTRHL